MWPTLLPIEFARLPDGMAAGVHVELRGAKVRLREVLDDDGAEADRT